MSTYPDTLDDDTSLPRVDDNITEVGGDAINALRESTFAIEQELGINPAGSAGSVAARFDFAHNPDGSLKDSSLNDIGVASFPIDNPQVANNAGIKESKLELDYATADLNAAISVAASQLTITTALTVQNESKLNGHLQGSAILPDATLGRHVLSHIDINNLPSDSRDATFIWDGIVNKNGEQRNNENLATLLIDLNSELVDHESGEENLHPATAITVNTDNFKEIPLDATNVQIALDYLDQAETINLGEHRATQHSSGIPRIARSNLIDQVNQQYSINVVPETVVKTFLKHPPNAIPVDDTSVGDDLIKFFPNNDDYIFDSYFSQVKAGDIITVTYDNGIQTNNYIDSIRYLPGAEFVVRINGYNLFDADGYGDGYVSARIDRARADINTTGVFASAIANPTPSGTFSNLIGSVTIGSPKGATAFGLNFNPNQLDDSHYKLWLEFYPTGNPLEKTLSLPFIDVTGNSGLTPGRYTLEDVVQATNNNFRQIGYNYRFIAFAFNGEFGIMIADSINKASFAIISGDNSSGTLITGSYIDNVIGGNTLDSQDALGLGSLRANLASPSFINSWIDETAAQLPTKIIGPFQHRYAYVNGLKIDYFADTYLSQGDGYWPATIISKIQIGLLTVETTYQIAFDLSPAELKSGKTIIVQPTIEFDHANYFDSDYGRFTIKSINFNPACGDDPGSTLITIINGSSGTGDPLDVNPIVNVPVKLYFSEDSVSFNLEQIIDQSPTTFEFYRLHEIYVTDKGKTFSHERARMPRQPESTTLLNTNKWHISNVSSKLRGYKDGDGSFNKYIRLYITEYNLTSGEFDGYLGQRDPFSINIFNIGESVHGKKNTPVKFFDETGIDFIELIFEETVSPGTLILSTAISRYVDIEIFESLAEHDEFLLLSTCEVNWDPDINADVIQHLVDRRQFGSIKTKDLSQQAIQFISSAERELNKNGVINGFDFVDISNFTINLAGGVALVDGNLFSVNPNSINIPNVWEFNVVSAQVMTWAICLNSEKQFVTVLISPFKKQFYVTPDGSSNYFLPSYTFYQLINTENKLLPLYLVTVPVISPGVFGSLGANDVRQYLKQESSNIPLVISGNEITGNFLNFKSAAIWLRNYILGNFGQYQVYCKGDIIIEETIDLTSFPSIVSFIGDGCLIHVNADKGFLLDSNITFKNINFLYGANIGSATDFINSNDGCLYLSPGSDANNIVIDGCKFTSNTSNSYRPPFISFELEKGQVLNQVEITGNTFIDSEDTENFAAISIVNLNTGASSIPALVANIKIDGNVCHNFQGIYITSKAVANVVGTPGLSASNCIISNNSCGIIGTHLSGKHNITISETYLNPAGIIIQGNTCRYIGSLSGNGKHVLSTGQIFDFSYSTSNTLITQNQTHWIDHTIFSTVFEFGQIKSNVTISNNILKAWNSSWKDNFTPDGYASDSVAIAVFDDMNTADGSVANIVNNITSFGVFDDVLYTYEGCVFTFVSGVISSNVFKGISGLHDIIKVFSEAGRFWNISNNEMYRSGNIINSYIFNLSPSNLNARALVANNILDSNTTNGSNTLVFVNTDGCKWIVNQNINQTHTLIIRGAFGNKTINKFLFNPNFISTIEIDDSTVQTIKYNYADTGGLRTLTWLIPIIEVIPLGAKIISASVIVDCTNTPTVTGNATLLIRNSADSASDTDTITSSPITLTANAGLAIIESSPHGNGVISLTIMISSSISCRVDIDAITVTYKW